MRSLVTCGVTMPGFDQLHPHDERLAELVWSWAPSQPAAGDCAAQGDDGRFHSDDCASVRRFACVSPSGEWTVTATAGPWQDGPAACAAEFAGSSYTVPWNGLANQQLLEAGAGDVWLNYAQQGGTWVPNAA
jgi:hypothetical protein